MADTTSLNPGKERGSNTSLSKYFKQEIGHAIHLLECQFHINEILLNHVIRNVHGKPTAPDRMSSDLAYNPIKQLKPSETTTTISFSSTVSAASRAANSLKSSLSWILDTDAQGKKQ